jgi:hippurate hydrolase
MDALPMPEDTGLPFASREAGRMHACGHDAHTAMLAMAVRLLHARRDRLAGTVKFMFQPGEEGYFGALRMIEDGLIDARPTPDAAFALHVSPNVPAGVIAARSGALMASADSFKIQVKGRGGHASMPHLACDPIPVACEIVVALQSAITRRIDAFDPVVLTVAKIQSGTTNNVIPESVFLEGTMRAISERARKNAHAVLTQVAARVAEAHGAVAEVVVDMGYGPTVNDARAVALCAETVRAALGEGNYVTMPAPVMGAEDWSYVLQRIPGCMAFLGVAPPDCDHHAAAPCHSNRMMLDESAMAHGIAFHAAVAERFLETGLPGG